MAEDEEDLGDLIRRYRKVATEEHMLLHLHVRNQEILPSEEEVSTIFFYDALSRLAVEGN